MDPVGKSLSALLIIIHAKYVIAVVRMHHRMVSNGPNIHGIVAGACIHIHRAGKGILDIESVGCPTQPEGQIIKVRKINDAPSAEAAHRICC